MELSEAKERVKMIEERLAHAPFIEFAVFTRDGRSLHVALTDRLRRCARKQRLWCSRDMLITLKNAAYGFDEQHARSVGGRDGIFIMDRSFHPANEMMRKLFDRFLDAPGSAATELAAAMGAGLDKLLPVRLVSHHLRLLGLLLRRADSDLLVLVDCDATK